MADNEQDSAGNWNASDDLGNGLKVQRVKVGVGVDGSYADVNTANPMPVAVMSGGGGAVTIADGGDVTQGAKADAAWTGSGAGSIVAILKALWTALTGTVSAILGAGENHIGKVGGELTVATAAPTITASSAYASGNCIGGKMTFTGLGRIAGLTGLIQMGLVLSKSNQSFAADLILFHTDPAASTFTDKAALSVNAADFDKILGRISFASTDWANAGTPSFAQQSALAMAYKVATGATDIYGVLVSRGTPTFTTTSDLKVVVKGLLD